MENEVEKPQYVELAPGTIASDYALKSLNKALGEAQNEFAPAVKNEFNAFSNYAYTPLSAIISAVRPSLAKYHLTVSQFPIVDLESKTLTIYTRLVHWDTGEWMQNSLEVPAELALGKDGTPKFNQQTIGGSQTYAQKYAYKAIVGIPDGEEMIDSSEEKGDLPSRSKGKPKQSTQDFVAQKSSQGWNDRQKVQSAKQAAPANQEVPKGIFQLLPPDQVKCVLINVAERESKSGKPIVAVKFNGDIPLNQEELTNGASTFDTGLFDALKAGLNKEVHLRYRLDKEQRFANIVDVFSVDGTDYVNGEPVIEDVSTEGK